MQNPAIITRQVTLTTMPPVFLRGEHVPVLIRNQDNMFILGTKEMYPEGIARLVGGGLDEDTPLKGAIREVQEELQIALTPDQLTPLARVAYHISHSEDIVFTAHLFFASIDQPVHPSDDLDGIIELSELELEKLIEKYAQLTSQTLPDLGFSWKDYGIIFGDLHQIALDKVRQLQL